MSADEKVRAKKVIYDLGANNGDDIPYYLIRADLVVAVEANPALASEIELRFAKQISAGRLVIENCAVTASGPASQADFYIHKANHVLSQLGQPSAAQLDEFSICRVPTKPLLDIIRTHGEPYFIKIDLEGYDEHVLRALFAGGIRPRFVSVEAHTIDVFLILCELGGYRAFKLVSGNTVQQLYSNRVYTSENTGEALRYSFPFHSAGPFGNDIDGKWMTREGVIKLLAFEGSGWRDIHATNTENPDEHVGPQVLQSLGHLVTLRELWPYVTARTFSTGCRRLRSLFRL